MAVIARSPAQVVAGEMTYASPEATWRDALAIASVIANRAISLGVTPQQVVGIQKEFNAYAKGLPAGADVELAQQAIDNVNEFGPTTTATFYAMPRAVDNLPPGLNQIDAVDGGHRYFEDPQERGIRTAVGTRAPTNLATARSAAAQRAEYEQRLAAEEGMPTPEARPDILNITQNPALLSAAPLSMVDPNISTGIPAISALTQMPDMALAQSLQSPQAAINSPQALQAALSSMGAGMLAQRDYMPNVEVAQGVQPGQPEMANVDAAKGSRIGSVDMSRFGEEVGPVARSVKTVSIPAQINTPRALSDALSVAGLEQGMDAQRTTAMPSVDVAKSGRIGSMPTVDVAKSDRAIASPQSRFAGPQNVPISQADIARAFVNATGQSQFDPSFTEGLMSASNPVVPSAVPTASITPDMINSPEALSAAISAINGGQVPSSSTNTNALQSAVDSAARGPTPSLSADNALQAAIDGAVRGPTPSSFSMTDNPMQAAIDGAAKSPATVAAQPSLGVNSPEMQAMRDRVQQQSIDLQSAVDEANANGNMLSFERTSIPADVPANQTEMDTTDPTAEASLASASRTAPSVTMTPEQKSAYAEMAQAGFGAGLVNLAGNGRINGFGEWTPNVATTATPSLPAQTMTPQQIAGYEEAAKSFAQAGMLNIGQQPPTDLSGNLPTNFDVLGTAATPTVPALETVEVAPQPTVAAPVEDVAPAQITPAVTNAVPSVTKSLPAAQQRQSSAMDVWNGSATTGIATDGSTVSRLSGSKIGRYDPKFNQTMFSIDDGTTWSNPVAGNQLVQAAAKAIQPSVAPAAQPSGGLLSRLMSVLTGQVPTAVSPTDIGPTMGLDGGMSVGRDGPAGAPSGWGPGGSVTSPGSAGGYGSTNGIDPNSTR